MVAWHLLQMNQEISELAKTWSLFYAALLRPKLDVQVDCYEVLLFRNCIT